jgi:hypothetical protein
MATGHQRPADAKLIYQSSTLSKDGLSNAEPRLTKRLKGQTTLSGQFEHIQARHVYLKSNPKSRLGAASVLTFKT